MVLPPTNQGEAKDGRGKTISGRRVGGDEKMSEKSGEELVIIDKGESYQPP